MGNIVKATNRMTDAAGLDENLPTRVGRQRLPWLDVLRALAIIDIVAVHTGIITEFVDGHPIRHKVHLLWGMGLPVFLLCSIGLGAIRTPPRPFKEQVLHRGARLMKPYAIWWVLYLVVNTIRHETTGDWRFATIDSLNIAHLILGTEYLLWYLPFIFFAEVLANGLQNLTDRFSVKRPGTWVAIWTGIGVVMLWLMPSASWLIGEQAVSEAAGLGFSWYRSLPCVPLGLALAIGLRMRRDGRGPMVGLFAVGVVGMVMAMHVDGPLPWGVDMNWARRMMLGVALVAGVSCLMFKTPRWTAQWASWTFGIYLVHIMVVWPVDAIFWNRPGTPLWLPTWLGSALIVVGYQWLVKKVGRRKIAHHKRSESSVSTES